MDYKHQVFNPMWGSLSMICATMEEAGWMLYNVVNVHQYESVAIFIRPKVEEAEELEHTGDYL